MEGGQVAEEDEGAVDEEGATRDEGCHGNVDVTPHQQHGPCAHVQGNNHRSKQLEQNTNDILKWCNFVKFKIYLQKKCKDLQMKLVGIEL